MTYFLANSKTLVSFVNKMGWGKGFAALTLVLSLFITGAANADWESVYDGDVAQVAKITSALGVWTGIDYNVNLQNPIGKHYGANTDHGFNYTHEDDLKVLAGIRNDFLTSFTPGQIINSANFTIRQGSATDAARFWTATPTFKATTNKQVDSGYYNGGTGWVSANVADPSSRNYTKEGGPYSFYKLSTTFDLNDALEGWTLKSGNFAFGDEMYIVRLTNSVTNDIYTAYGPDIDQNKLRTGVFSFNDLFGDLVLSNGKYTLDFYGLTTDGSVDLYADLEFISYKGGSYSEIWVDEEDGGMAGGEEGNVGAPDPNSTVTPEPASMLIFGLGLAGLGLCRRMRKNIVK